MGSTRMKVAKVGIVGLFAGLMAASVEAQTPAQPKVSTAGQGSTAKKRSAGAASAYDRALLKPALLKANAPEEYKVKFVTTRGEFTLTVHRAWAPLGADRFYNLVRHHFFDNASIFRVVPGFVAQFGISAYPAVTTAWKGTDIKDDPVKESNKRGYITFATAGPNTRTTQVFINLKDNTALDRQGFAPFGVVDAEGMKVVDMFYDQYGDGAGIDQGKIESQGNSYLQKSYPKLDIIKSATLLTTSSPAASKPPAGKSAAPTKKPQ